MRSCKVDSSSRSNSGASRVSRRKSVLPVPGLSISRPGRGPSWVVSTERHGAGPGFHTGRCCRRRTATSAPINPTMPARHNEPTIRGSVPSVWNDGASDDSDRADSSADRAGRIGSADRTGPTASADTTGRTASADTTGRTASADTTGWTASSDTTGPTASADTTGRTDGDVSSGAFRSSAPSGSLTVVGARPIVPTGFSALGQACEKIVTMSLGAATGGVTPTATSGAVTLIAASAPVGDAAGPRAGTGIGEVSDRTFLAFSAKYQQRIPVGLLTR